MHIGTGPGTPYARRSWDNTAHNLWAGQAHLVRQLFIWAGFKAQFLLNSLISPGFIDNYQEKYAHPDGDKAAGQRFFFPEEDPADDVERNQCGAGTDQKIRPEVFPKSRLGVFHKNNPFFLFRCHPITFVRGTGHIFSFPLFMRSAGLLHPKMPLL